MRNSEINSTAVTLSLNRDLAMSGEERHSDCIIIGAGISGLEAAYYKKVSDTISG